ncbi:hypothetical protein GQ44DRAFT_619687, partial [Phaeosphaeriaceae sp. PMI808]
MPQWSPEDVLQLCDDGRCVGYAPSKRRKCMMRISYGNEMECQYLISEMAEEQPNADLLEPKLRRLAQHGLCVQFHQNQVDDMVRKWSLRIRTAYPP